MIQLESLPTLRLAFLIASISVLRRLPTVVSTEVPYNLNQTAYQERSAGIWRDPKIQVLDTKSIEALQRDSIGPESSRPPRAIARTAAASRSGICDDRS